jgi:hypothetical protein
MKFQLVLLITVKLFGVAEASRIGWGALCR